MQKNEALSSEVVIIDEADLVLERDFTHLAGAVWPKRFVLLSALPKKSWSAIQELAFSHIKGKRAHYIDVSSVFPVER